VLGVVHFKHLLLEFVHRYRSLYGGIIGIVPLNIKIEMDPIQTKADIDLFGKISYSF
jgi:hypothetical protein